MERATVTWNGNPARAPGLSPRNMHRDDYSPGNEMATRTGLCRGSLPCRASLQPRSGALPTPDRARFHLLDQAIPRRQRRLFLIAPCSGVLAVPMSMAGLARGAAGL